MSLYICSECGSIDNTALTAYWWRTAASLPPLCSACQSGQWHGAFSRVQATDAERGSADEHGLIRR